VLGILLDDDLHNGNPSMLIPTSIILEISDVFIYLNILLSPLEIPK